MPRFSESFHFLSSVVSNRSVPCRWRAKEGLFLWRCAAGADPHAGWCGRDNAVDL